MIVYVYTFPNGKRYVGQTIQSLSKRSQNGNGYKNQFVYKAIQKYGWINIEIETYECSSQQEMDELERSLIKKFNSNDKRFGYNLDSGGNLYKRHSEETKIKIKNSEKGKAVSEETKLKIRENSTSSKKVICIETKTIYPSAAEAARQLNLTKNSAGNINKVCNHNKYRQTAGGYHWAWLENYENEDLK